MGWWKTGEGDDIIGDLPADVIGRAFAMISDMHQHEDGTRPALADILQWLLSAMAQTPGTLEDMLPESTTTALVATTDYGTIESGGAGKPAGEKILGILTEALDTLALDYHDAVQRLPSGRELMATVTFVLAADPSRYLEWTPGNEIQDIRLECPS